VCVRRWICRQGSREISSEGGRTGHLTPPALCDTASLSLFNKGNPTPCKIYLDSTGLPYLV